MHYVIHFDVAALIVTITVLVHFFWKKTINTKYSKIFTLFMLLALVSNAFDLITIYTIEHPACIPIWLHYLLNEIYLVTFNGTLAVYFIYLMLTTVPASKITRFDQIRMYLPVALDIILILTTPLTSFVFYMDENRKYTHGPGIVLLYVMAFYYVISAVFHTIHYRSKFNMSQSISIYFYTLLCIAAIILQATTGGLMLAQFAASIAVLLIYLSLENPMDYMDKEVGTYNRLAFQEIFTQQLEKNHPYEVLGIRILGVNYITEAMGLKQSIQLLMQIAQFLTQTFWPMKVFYLPSNEFAIISERKRGDWNKLFLKVQSYFKNPIKVNGVESPISISMCMFTQDTGVERFEDAIDVMNYALDQAEEADNDQVVYADQDMLLAGKREAQILQEMQTALAENGFQVFYQPIYSVQKQKYTSAEALIRFKPRSLVFISPEEFIPIAEKHGLILDIGEFVFRDVCRFISEQKLWESGIESVDVNLSTVQCMQNTLHSTLISIMDEFHLDYSCISLEITETAAAISGKTLQHNMEKLISKGIVFSMDDYGTGFSNIINLIEYPFDIIKLDKSLVWSAMENPKAMCALKHTICMVKDMGMKLIAEGVETKEHVNRLTSMGCDFFQGYYFSKPVCESDFLQILAQ